MKNLLQIGTIKVSPVFVVLIILTFGVFAFAMINLTRLPTPEEKREETMRQMGKIMLAEQAQAMGGTVEDVKRRQKDNEKKNELTRNLIKAIKQKDNVAVDKLIHELKEDYKRISNIFFDAGNANNEYAFRALLETGIPCNYSSHSGSQAFMSAISSENPAFLNLLLEKQCNYTPRSESDSLGKRIVQSRYPEKVFQLKENRLDVKYRDQALVQAIKKKKIQQVLNMLDLGANPNAASNRKNMSALFLSLRYKMPQVTLRLIQKGANIETEHLVDRFEVLSWAIYNGYMDIAQEVIKRNPDHIQRKNLSLTTLTAALSTLNDSVLRREAVMLLLQQGVEPKKLQNGGINWLIKTVKLQDPILVKQLLDSGIDPNIRDKMQMALGIAKSINISKTRDVDKPKAIAKKEKIIAILEQYGATDDLLAIIRKERGIDLDVNCKIGRWVDIETKAMVERYAQRKQKNSKAPNNLRQCSIVAENCVNQGYGADDCMHSVKTCTASDKMGQASLCCTDKLKKRYFEARCSKLDVSESRHWMALSAL